MESNSNIALWPIHDFGAAIKVQQQQQMTVSMHFVMIFKQSHRQIIVMMPCILYIWIQVSVNKIIIQTTESVAEQFGLHKQTIQRGQMSWTWIESNPSLVVIYNKKESSKKSSKPDFEIGLIANYFTRFVYFLLRAKWIILIINS